MGILKELEKSKDTARGVKGDDMLGKSNSATGEILGASVEADKQRYKVDAESRSESNGEVGYGHSSEEVPKMRVWSEGSLVSRSLETKGRDRMNAKKAQTMLEEARLRKLEYKLYVAARMNPKRRFGVLYDHMCDLRMLRVAWKRVKANRGTSGIDGESIEQVISNGEEEFLKGIQKSLKDGTYCPKPVKRVYIPKANGKKRPLGIPALRDRVVQMVCKLVIEPLFEADFCTCSYGFRPGRSNQEAVKTVWKAVNRQKWIVDVDLQGYFDTINHDLLMREVKKRVSDPKVLRLIWLWLKAGIMEEGKLRTSELGTPQGGVLSPLLSNIFLHVIDKQWENICGVKLVRFADDMVLLCTSEKQAGFVLQRLKGQLEKQKLILNEEKTRVVHVKESFDFLGFTFREGYSRQRRQEVRIAYPKTKSVEKFQKNLKDACKVFQLGGELGDLIDNLNRKLKGWINYFKIGTSYKQVLKVTEFACQQLRIFLRRRTCSKATRGYERWPNRYFYERGLIYGPSLL